MNFIKKNYQHLIVVLLFAVLSVGYMFPILQGKEMQQSDKIQAYAGQSEIYKYQKEKPGEYIGWTNSMFGGTPTYMVGGDYAEGIFVKMQRVVYYLLSVQGTYIFLYLLGCYILCLALGMGIFPSIITCIAFGFFSTNILIIEAGHLAKVYALAFVPMMLAGLVIGFRKSVWLGAIVFSIGLGFEVNANHYQITYYSLFVIAILVMVELYNAVKDGRMKQFITASLLFGLVGITVVGTNTSRLWTTFDFQKETIRGGSELTAAKGEAKKEAEGLDKDYAFEWSYGVLESFTLLIPNFSGGSRGDLNEKSEVYKNLTSLGVGDEDASNFTKNITTYWGDQRFVGGTSYSGAIICFLFVLSLFFIDKKNKIIFLTAGAVCLLIAWGKNLSAINFLLFDYLPLFNKFRAVSMILSLVQLCLVIMAGLGLQKIFSKKPTWETFKKPFFISLGSTAGLCLLFSILSSIFGYKSVNDPQLLEGLKQSFQNNESAVNNLYSALKEDRASLLRTDALRSLVFILLAALTIFLFVKDKLKNVTLVGTILAILVLIDLWGVDRRYLNKDDFDTRPAERSDLFTQSPADIQILQDKDLSYRIIDLTAADGPFTSAIASAFHKNIGGYSAAKLKRYADILERQLSKNNMVVLDMFNTKYFITADAKGGQIAQPNPNALGNAWFVKNIKIVNNADEEMASLDSIKPRETAFVDAKFKVQVADFKGNSNPEGMIKLTNYHPNKLIYEFNSPTAQAVVFSEVFYKGNQDWISKIDGQVKEHFRTDYLFRGIVVPAGKHQIEFSFEPKSVIQGRKYDQYANFAWILMIVGFGFMYWKNAKSSSATMNI
jgi:hypothetical protein